MFAGVVDEYARLALAELHVANDGIADNVVARLRAAFIGVNTPLLSRIAANIDIAVRGLLERILGVSLSEVTSSNVQVAAVQRSTLLIRDLQNTTIENVQRVLLAPANQGVGTRRLAHVLEQELGVTRRKAQFWARDQTLKLHAQITQHRHQEAGVSHYYWMATNDERTRQYHADLHRSEQSWDEPPVTNAAGDRNHPGEDYNCRCFAYPVIRGASPR